MEDNLFIERTIFWIVTACGVGGSFIPFLVKMVMQVFLRETDMESNLRRQACDLKAELGGISMVDEFAKYAKIQRKVNKVTDELANQSKLRASYVFKVRLIATGALYAIEFGIIIMIMWNYSNVAIITLPEHWLYPLGSILAFPTNVPGGIGLSTWLMICGTTGKTFANILT